MIKTLIFASSLMAATAFATHSRKSVFDGVGITTKIQAVSQQPDCCDPPPPECPPFCPPGGGIGRAR